MAFFWFLPLKRFSWRDLSSEEARDWVLEHGPWHIQNIPLVVLKWEPGMTSLEFSFDKFLIWVQLYGIPLELYTRRGISYIASALGLPLYMDRITAEKSRLVYAKVCIEIDVAHEVPSVVSVVLQDGSTVDVTVEIPRMPHKCSSCSVFGHTSQKCPGKGTVQEGFKRWKL
ncbi:uncharacterized protein LOC120184314 [Hibiscus syriacus]|uniref:uncharacterized protein LOC120184314 n=1 Tax=Hibiscus syriacus TaxID=106335 RepID=UPI001924FC73|nr:uncharacterized protein LOC120184314 [Hibiscus syriacus]